MAKVRMQVQTQAPVQAQAQAQACRFCGRTYQRKVYYNRHIVVCELLSKTTKERQIDYEESADTPPVRELYEIILELANKVTHLEKKLNDLSKWADTKKRKIKVEEWLNEKYTGLQAPLLDLATFLEKICVVRSHLEYLFQHDYLTCIGKVLQDMLPVDGDRNVLKAFDHKYNVLFVYDASQWQVLTEPRIQAIITVITKQLWQEFVVWQKENALKMVQDDFAVTYATNAKKMMAGNTTPEQIYNRTKLDLYKYLKLPLGAITEVEFV